jgi:carbamoyltransferase
MTLRIHGVFAFYHDSAAALVVDGAVVVAQEERFTRKEHDSGVPRHAIESVLPFGRVALSEIDYVVFYDKPFLKFERLLETHLSIAARGFSSFRMAVPLWLKENRFQKSLLKEILQTLDPKFPADRLLFAAHHQSHAASAFFPSPFEEAVV